jgi:hypothetical protein
MNVDFFIHRNAEWTMLMLGESIFSLVVEDVSESEGFFTTFYCGLVIVIFLMYIHFKNQPMEAERHVLVNSKNRALISTMVQTLYSASLVGMGAGLTLFLKTFATKQSYRRWLSFVLEGRILAGGGDQLYSPYEMKERAASVFSISLGMVLICVDTLTFLHVGLDQTLETLRKKDSKTKFLVPFFTLMRLFLTIFVLTLCLWNTSAEQLAGIGLGCVFFYDILSTIVDRLMAEN